MSASRAPSLVPSLLIRVGVCVVVVVDWAPSVPSPGTSRFRLVVTSTVLEVVVCTGAAVVTTCRWVVVVCSTVVEVVVVELVVVGAVVVVVSQSGAAGTWHGSPS